MGILTIILRIENLYNTCLSKINFKLQYILNQICHKMHNFCNFSRKNIDKMQGVFIKKNHQYVEVTDNQKDVVLLIC